MIGVLNYTFDSAGLGQRGIADLIEERVKNGYRELVKDTPLEWKNAPTVRSIEDFSISHGDSKIFYDVKTTDLDRNFSMPNLISAKRLHRLYQNPNNQVVYVLVSYAGIGAQKRIVSVEERPIETLSWDRICIQNLGEGQLQLVGKGPIPQYKGDRSEWMVELKSRMMDYLDRTITKMEKRKHYWKS